jgi:hypothetical protein
MGPDGHYRSEKEERRINLAVVSALGGTQGEELMTYLRSITVNVASGPEISDRALMHLEGMRFLVGVLSTRINLGHKAKNNVDDQEK